MLVCALQQLLTTPQPDAEAGQADNLEFLYVDGLEEGTAYAPPAFLEPFVDHEVVGADERARFALRALSERTARGP